MQLPAPEFDILEDLADSNSAMVLPLTGEQEGVEGCCHGKAHLAQLR
jgi:hypothetical protein